jgi:hypothetical protein
MLGGVCWVQRTCCLRYDRLIADPVEQTNKTINCLGCDLDKIEQQFFGQTRSQCRSQHLKALDVIAAGLMSLAVANWATKENWIFIIFFIICSNIWCQKINLLVVWPAVQGENYAKSLRNLCVMLQSRVEFGTEPCCLVKDPRICRDRSKNLYTSCKFLNFHDISHQSTIVCMIFAFVEPIRHLHFHFLLSSFECVGFVRLVGTLTRFN